MQIKQKTKKGYRYLIGFLMVLIFLSQPLTVSASEYIQNSKKEHVVDKIVNEIPVGATQFVNNNYKNIIEVVKAYAEDFNLKLNDLKDLTLGTPYVVLNLDESSQDEIYYFPIISNGKVILNLSVMGTTDGWSLSISEEMVTDLNSIDYTTNYYIFYASEDSIVAENENETINLSDEENEKCNGFKSMEFDNKVEVIADAMDDFVSCDLNYDGGDILEKYIAGFSTSTSTAKILALFNAKGQGGDNMCWAASVATIVNYINGTNITGANVCDAMGIGYNEGANISEKQTALSNYGVLYNTLIYSQTSWSKIKVNIDSRRPIAASAVSGLYGHAVTVYGYRTISTTDYIVFWNSALNSGSGGTQISYYNPNGTTFTSGGYTYTWVYSLSSS